MAEHPLIASLVLEMCSSGDMIEYREPVFLCAETSPSETRGSTAAKTSYLFNSEASFRRVLPAVQSRAKSRGSGVTLDFAGEIDDLPLQARSKLYVPLEVTHAITYTCEFDHEYRIVRRCGDLFYKFFSSPEEAWREAAIHRHMWETRPDAVVPFVDIQAASSIIDHVPNFKYEPDELPFCIITRSPPEPFVLLNDITDFQEAKRAVYKLKDLLETMYRDYGFVHGDVHGKNVILSSDDSTLLLDLGMSEIHNKDLSEHLKNKYDADVAHNNFSDEDVFLHVINDCNAAASTEPRVSRAEYMHLYDIGRAVHRGVPRFQSRLLRHFLPDIKEDPETKRLKSSDFQNHFKVAHKMLNLKYNNLAAKRLRSLNDKTNSARIANFNVNVKP